MYVIMSDRNIALKKNQAEDENIKKKRQALAGGLGWLEHRLEHQKGCGFHSQPRHISSCRFDRQAECIWEVID